MSIEEGTPQRGGLKTWREIGEDLGISATRTQQIAWRAADKILDEIVDVAVEDEELRELLIRILADRKKGMLYDD